MGPGWLQNSLEHVIVAPSVLHPFTLLPSACPWDSWSCLRHHQDALEKEMTTHSGILAWIIHGQRSLVGDSPLGRKRVGHDLATKPQETSWPPGISSEEEEESRLVKQLLSRKEPFSPVRMIIIKKSINSKCWRGSGERGTLLHCCWEYKLVRPLWRTARRFLEKLKIDLPYDPAVPLLGIYLEKTIIINDKHTHQSSLQHYLPLQDMEVTYMSINNWMDIERVVNIYIWILLSHKKNKIMPFAATWIDLVIIIPSEVSQREKDKYNVAYK